MNKTGGTEVFEYTSVDVEDPGPNEVLVRQSAIGVNFLDVYFRSGFFKPGGFPFVNGFEGAGTVEKVGADVTEFSVGDRVGYQLVLGAYADLRVMKTDRLIKLPEHISDTQAAAAMLKGTTAEFLLRRVYQVGKSDTVLVHAAAGGVGTILTQWAKHLGATVIGTVSTEEKAKVARECGCDHVYVTNESEDFVSALQGDLGEHPVSVFYDGVGEATFARSLDVLKNFGWGILYGWASGRVQPIDPHALQARSLTITSPSLGHYTATREQLQTSADALFEAVADGAVRLAEPTTYALAEVGKAHSELEGRQTTGSVVLIP